MVDLVSELNLPKSSQNISDGASDEQQHKKNPWTDEEREHCADILWNMKNIVLIIFTKGILSYGTEKLKKLKDQRKKS